MTGRGIDQILLHPGVPAVCKRFIDSATEYVAVVETDTEIRNMPYAKV